MAESHYLRQFDNLLLDECVSFDLEELDRLAAKRLKQQERKAQKLSGLWPGQINPVLISTSLARRCFLYDHLPPGALSVYDTDTNSYILNRQNHRSFTIDEAQSGEVFVPIFDCERTNIKSEERATQWFLKQEHDALFALLDKTEQRGNSVGELNAAALNTAFRQIEQHNLVVSNIIVGENAMASIESFASQLYDRESHLVYPRIGHLFTADVYHTPHPMLANKMFLLSSRETVGVFPDRGYMTVFGYHRESYGMVLVNPYSVSCVEVI